MKMFMIKKVLGSSFDIFSLGTQDFIWYIKDSVYFWKVSITYTLLFTVDFFSNKDSGAIHLIASAPLVFFIYISFSWMSRAKPKSAIFNVKLSWTKMLRAAKSRWTSWNISRLINQNAVLGRIFERSEKNSRHFSDSTVQSLPRDWTDGFLDSIGH